MMMSLSVTKEYGHGKGKLVTLFLKTTFLFSQRKCSLKTDSYRQFPLVPAPDPEQAGQRRDGAGHHGEHEHHDQRHVTVTGNTGL